MSLFSYLWVFPYSLLPKTLEDHDPCLLYMFTRPHCWLVHDWLLLLLAPYCDLFHGCCLLNRDPGTIGVKGATWSGYTCTFLRLLNWDQFPFFTLNFTDVDFPKLQVNIKIQTNGISLEFLHLMGEPHTHITFSK